VSVTLTVTTARVGRPLRSLAISKDDASAARVASAPKQRCASALESVVYLGHGQTASDPAEVEKEGEGVALVGSVWRVESGWCGRPWLPGLPIGALSMGRRPKAFPPI